MRRFAVVAGGGTGGHLVPAMALARLLGDGREPGAVEVVGSRRGLDEQLLADSGLPFTLLPGRGLLRRFAPRALWANVGAVAGLVLALARSLVLVGRRRPAVVVAMGGYASVALALAAAAWRVPVVLVNVDAVPGAANRLVGRFARAAAVAFTGTALPRAVVTGAPIRPEIAALATRRAEAPMAARRVLGLPEDRAVVAAVGGSLGARRVNEAVVDLARRWSARSDVAVYHVVGRRDMSWARAACPAGEGLVYRQVEFEHHMEHFYLAADVVVSRSGANTVAELAVAGVPSVLVPLPGAPADHQSANARALADAGAAVVLQDEDCDGAHLEAELDSLLSDRPRLVAMARAAQGLGRADALVAVARLVEQHARRVPGPVVAA